MYVSHVFPRRIPFEPAQKNFCWTREMNQASTRLAPRSGINCKSRIILLVCWQVNLWQTNFDIIPLNELLLVELNRLSKPEPFYYEKSLAEERISRLLLYELEITAELRSREFYLNFGKYLIERILTGWTDLFEPKLLWWLCERKIVGRFLLYKLQLQ